MSIRKHKGWLALGLLILITIGGVLFLLVNFRTAIGKLRADHDKGVALIRKHLSIKPVRPVLRGEALAGNGGPKLLEILDVIKSERPKPPWGLLLRDARGDVDTDSEPKVAEAYAYGGKFLPEVREALQHEYCRLPLDYVEVEWGEDNPLKMRITFLQGVLLQDAKQLASKGEFEAALRDISDAIRLGHDLRRGTGGVSFQLAAYAQSAAVECVARMLYEHPFPSKALEAWVAEVRLLQSTRPAYEFGGLVDEYGPIIALYRKHMAGLTGQFQDLAAKTGFSIGIFNMGGLHLEDYHEAFEEFRRITSLEFSKAEAEMPEFQKLCRKIGGIFDGPIDPIRVKRAILHHEMEWVCLEAGLLAHIYYASHNGAWPEALSECGDIPPDPWDGKPLRYKPPSEGKPAIVYSISEDRKDDGGAAKTPFGGNSGKNADYVFPLGPWPEEEQTEPE